MTHFVRCLSKQAEEGEYSEGTGGTQQIQMIYGVAALSLSNYLYHYPVTSVYEYELKLRCLEEMGDIGSGGTDARSSISPSLC